MNNFEIDLVKNAEAIVDSMCESLSQFDLTLGGIEIQIWDATEKNYTSEFRLPIFKNGELEDMLEFHIYDKGILKVEKVDALKWIREQLVELTGN